MYGRHNIPAIKAFRLDIAELASQDSFTGNMVNLGFFVLLILIIALVLSAGYWVITSDEKDSKNERPGY